MQHSSRYFHNFHPLTDHPYRHHHLVLNSFAFITIIIMTINKYLEIVLASKIAIHFFYRSTRSLERGAGSSKRSASSQDLTGSGRKKVALTNLSKGGLTVFLVPFY